MIGVKFYCSDVPGLPGLPWWPRVKNPAGNAGDTGVGKIPWRRNSELWAEISKICLKGACWGWKNRSVFMYIVHNELHNDYFVGNKNTPFFFLKSVQYLSIMFCICLCIDLFTLSIITS